MAKELAREEDLIFLCGHYEGIDERVLEEIVTDYISIGDYVLTGGELPALVLMDAISRMVPGVLGNSDSGESESHSNYLLEYPQYSRPEIWNGKSVPPVLLSGDHAKVEEWRLEKSIERTAQMRPDLYEKWASENEEYFIRKAKREERKRKNELRKLKKAQKAQKAETEGKA
jgi:tRNA (guanine37-N1)-methyltransferase